ncbi:hypothetical protein PF008_g15358 [Phytophthora fragariae]|uniref:Uncharacterized protein n=1 Tax=Phytophthora fragariae TaxID=53985 RepID=A0A6G0REC2_9STRA|nr:hypothetical protein PF008_g15358 [Phytophthora fragariae]
MMDVLVEYEALAARDANDAVGAGDHARLSVDEDDPAVIVTVVLVSYEAQVQLPPPSFKMLLEKTSTLTSALVYD